MSAIAVEAQKFRELNDRLRALLRPIQVLQTLRWPAESADRFLAQKCTEEPTLPPERYPSLSFDVDRTISELNSLRRDAERRWPVTAAGRFLDRRCEQAITMVDMVRHRGTPRFSALSRSAFRWSGKSTTIETSLSQLKALEVSLTDQQCEHERYEAYTAASLLAIRMAQVMVPVVGVAVDPNLASDAIAGRSGIRLRHDGQFTRRDLRLLEVHEAWIHFVTTEHAARQPFATALTRGNPPVWRTQEGMAVLAEVSSNVTSRDRIRRIRMRFEAVHMADQGADFRTLHRHFMNDGDLPADAFRRAMRIVRGAYPAPGAFFKDACYAAGLLQVSQFVTKGGDLTVLTCGKSAIEESADLADLARIGWVVMPSVLPAPLRNRDQLVQSAHRVLGHRAEPGGVRISNEGFSMSSLPFQPARP